MGMKNNRPSYIHKYVPKLVTATDANDKHLLKHKRLVGNGSLLMAAVQCEKIGLIWKFQLQNSSLILFNERTRHGYSKKTQKLDGTLCPTIAAGGVH